MYLQMSIQDLQKISLRIKYGSFQAPKRNHNHFSSHSVSPLFLVEAYFVNIWTIFRHFFLVLVCILFLEICCPGATEISQQLRAYATFAEDLN